VLIADDNIHYIEMMRFAFQQIDTMPRLDFVHDGEQVLQFLQHRLPRKASGDITLPDVLLLDLKMPRLDGFQVLEWLRGRPPFHKLPVIVFSSSDQPVDIDRAISLGAARYLVKPCRMADLAQMVRVVEKFCQKLHADRTHAANNPDIKHAAA
jgi:CheY-like chemotaxis protein